MSKKFLKLIGNNIKFTRKNEGISQEKLSELTGYSRNYIGMIERGEANPPIDTLCKIAKVLKMKPEQLFIS